MNNLFLHSIISEYDFNADGVTDKITTELFDRDGNLLSFLEDIDADGIIDNITNDTEELPDNLLGSPISLVGSIVETENALNSAPAYSYINNLSGLNNNLLNLINNQESEPVVIDKLDVHGNIMSHNVDIDGDEIIDYVVEFTNIYKSENQDKNSDDKETLIGSNQNDLIRDSKDNSNIYGYDGDDSLFGGNKGNLIDGGADSDIISGNGGHDRLFGGHGNDVIHGNQGKDLLLGGFGNDRLFGGYANDVIHGNQGRDRLLGGFGNDRLLGGYGNDTLFGHQDDDLLMGNQGNDLLDGGIGSDTIEGGLGADTLTGRSGIDTFIFADAMDSPVDEPDVITDFTVGSDRLLLDFAPTAFTSAAIISVDSLVQANMQFNGLSPQVAFSATESILYIDSAAQGEADMAIKLNGVTSLDVADLF